MMVFSAVARGDAAPTRIHSPSPTMPVTVKPSEKALEIKQRITPSGHYILYHPDAIRDDGSYDVIIHFHGIPQALGPALRESGLRAVLLVLEAGVVTGDYGNAYGQSGTLERLLKAIRGHMSDIARGRDVHEARVAVSAWSAGSGAVLPMLRRAKEAALLDAVVISDGLHASFLEPLRRTIGDVQLEPVRHFAEDAIAGRKLFALSHTSIDTVDYASTTETANQLLQLLNLSPVHVVDPPKNDGPVATSRTEQGGFSVLGFDGKDKQAHARQQWAIGRLLWSSLATRWNRSDR
jgi:hypothetical protein